MQFLMNLPLGLLIGAVVVMWFVSKMANQSHDASADLTMPQVMEGGQGVDMGMYSIYNPNAFGTTKEGDRRVTNDGVRREFHHNAFPWAECTCEAGDCAKHGVPEPTMGHTHVCRNGFPSKRIIDMYGGHFQLNHMCAPGTGECEGEPAVLGRWWCRQGCSQPESVGVNVRPLCTRCK